MVAHDRARFKPKALPNRVVAMEDGAGGARRGALREAPRGARAEAARRAARGTRAHARAGAAKPPYASGASAR